MTNILRKKIDLSTGVPPSIHGADQFWLELCAATAGWVAKGLELSSEPGVVQRKMVIGEEVTGFAEEDDLLFTMPPTPGFGLNSIMLSRRLAIKFAADRMLQSEDSLNDASDLFLMLICEDPAMLLKESVKAHLTGSRHDFERDIGVDLSFAQTEIPPLRRYLQVVMELPLEGQLERLILYFDFDMLKKYLATYASAPENGNGQVELSDHSLIRKSLQKSDIRIDAVLERIVMTFGACSRLGVGQVLPLATANQNSISVAVDTVSGSTDISRGKLGTWKQCRAIKLSAPISENFVRDLTDF